MNIKIDPDVFSHFLLFFCFFFGSSTVAAGRHFIYFFVAVRDLRRHVSFPAFSGKQ